VTNADCNNHGTCFRVSTTYSPHSQIDSKHYNGLLNDSKHYNGLLNDIKHYNGLLNDSKHYNGLLNDSKQF
jgi:hypothetical protein